MSKQEILQLKEQGKSPREIATKLGISTQRVYQVLKPDYIEAYKKSDKHRKWFNEYQRKRNAKKREERNGR